MSCVAIIPARGGSQRIKRKNIKEFFGKPIIAYSIETAQKSGLFDCVFVSTDDDEIAEVAVQYGAYVLRREDSLAHNDIGTQEVMAEELRKLGTTDIEYACCVYPAAPMLQHTTLVYAYDVLVSNEADFVVPVATWLQDPGQFYFGTVEAFISGLDLIGEGTIMIKTEVERECDINTMEDWLEAEIKYKLLDSK